MDVFFRRVAGTPKAGLNQVVLGVAGIALFAHA